MPALSRNLALKVINRTINIQAVYLTNTSPALIYACKVAKSRRLNTLLDDESSLGIKYNKGADQCQHELK
jgi:hypothetical protein